MDGRLHSHVRTLWLLGEWRAGLGVPLGSPAEPPSATLDPSRTHMASMEDVAKPFSSPQGQREGQEGLALKVTYHPKPGLLQQLP